MTTQRTRRDRVTYTVVELKRAWMRSDYNKPHRCPAWSGPAWIAKDTRTTCPSGSVGYRYELRAWKWRPARCPKCGTVSLPYVLRWLDWRTWQLEWQRVKDKMIWAVYDWRRRHQP
jgi:hypothetical protein